jgi:hypothetical protein
MRFFATRAEAARYVTRELLPALERGCMLTTTIKQAKSGDYFVTFVITNSLDETAIQKLTSGLDDI